MELGLCSAGHLKCKLTGSHVYVTVWYGFVLSAFVPASVWNESSRFPWWNGFSNGSSKQQPDSARDNKCSMTNDCGKKRSSATLRLQMGATPLHSPVVPLQVRCNLSGGNGRRPVHRVITACMWIVWSSYVPLMSKTPGGSVVV